MLIYNIKKTDLGEIFEFVIVTLDCISKHTVRIIKVCFFNDFLNTYLSLSTLSQFILCLVKCLAQTHTYVIHVFWIKAVQLKDQHKFYSHRKRKALHVSSKRDLGKLCINVPDCDFIFYRNFSGLSCALLNHFTSSLD